MLIQEIHVPVSPASKKRQAQELVKKIKKKMQLEDPLDKVIVETDHGSDRKGLIFALKTLTFLTSKDSLVQSIFKEIGNPGANVNVSNMDTNTNSSDSPSTSILEKTMVIPPEVLQTESNTEEVRTSGINVHVSNMDINVNMGKGVLNNEAFGTSTLETSSIPTSLILSSTIESSILDTSTSLPPLFSPIPSSLFVSTISPTYSTIMQEQATTLFSSQSTEAERIVQDDDPNDDDIMVSFIDL